MSNLNANERESLLEQILEITENIKTFEGIMAKSTDNDSVERFYLKKLIAEASLRACKSMLIDDEKI